MHYKSYSAEIHFSEEDNVFYGKVIGINDLISFEGSTVNELNNAFEEAIEDYLIHVNMLKK